MSLADGATMSRASCFEWFLQERPDIKTITPSALNSFKMSITRTLNSLCGKSIIHLIKGGGTGNGALVYRKGRRRSTEPMDDERRREHREEGLALLEESDRALLPVERLQQATRAAAVELAYVETWGEHSPKSTEVLRLVVEAGKA